MFGNVINKLKIAEVDLHQFDLLAEDRDLNDSKKATRREGKKEVWRLSRMVEWMWLKKSRLNWAMKGDRNTRFSM